MHYLQFTVAAVVLAYLACGLLIYLAQDAIVFPGRDTQGAPEAEVTPPAGSEVVRLAAGDGETVAALFGPALRPDGKPHPEAAARPTILLFYGNGTWLAAAVPEMEEYRRLGANVLLAEYLGYGMSGGSACETGCYATADAAYEHAVSRPDVHPGRIVPVGFSLGGAVAIDLASRKPVAGVAAFNTFTSLVEMAQRQFPFLPAAPLVRHRFESRTKIARVTCPILLAHGTEDALIPFEMCGRLEAAAGGPVTRISVRGAGHNDLMQVGGAEVRRALSRLLDQAASR
jgi:pimeloyl-ACP methyl ester carboxylesterase